MWRAVGIQLGLSTDALDGIQQESAKSVSSCIVAYEMVFNQCPATLRTWGSIIQALRKPAVGNDELAYSLEQKYSQPLISALLNS